MLAARSIVPNSHARLSSIRAALLAGFLLLMATPGQAAGQQPAPSVQQPPAAQIPVPSRITRQIAPGIQHVQVVRESQEQPLAAHLLRADPKQPGWRLEVRSAKERIITADPMRGRDVVGRVAARTGALAAINGGFFAGTGDPLGLQISDGELISEPYPGRSAFGITRDGRALWGPVRFAATITIGGRSFPIHGVNRPRGANELILFTPRFAERTGTNPFGAEVVVEWLSGPLRAGVKVEGTISETRFAQGNTPIPGEGLVVSGHGAAATFLKAANTGDAVCVQIHLTGEAGESWDRAWQAIGAGPRLLKNGAICLKPGAEGFRSDVLQGRAPRSAIAMTRDGKLLLAAVDGRQMVSAGMTLLELAEWLREEGAVDAINLDGGGSTTLALRQLVVNQPSQGPQRPIANAVVIALDPQPAAEEGELALLAPEGMEPVGDALVMPAGTRVRFRAAKRLPDGTWQDLPEDAVTWSLEGQVGLLTQDGAFLPMRVGSGTVAFSTGQRIARARVKTVAGPPAAVTTRFEAPPALGEPATVWARVRDAYGNPVTGIKVTLGYATADGAQAVALETDAQGEARWALPLAPLLPDVPVTVVAGTAPAVPVEVPAAALAPTGTKPAPAGGAGEAAEPAVTPDKGR
ncbi:MAG TPA: phosphodiester glycosidase family protein [Armatimonadota bacterium]|nr:hypothetical protein [Armatimonadota bacterium]HOM80161.1 phosphodiester glycosidase family protein [Armatimonadota bacterium]HPO71585.1 phosphodiester glycosidase family protein [Armatimonadota bacterium]HPT97709.1 phosphodiester glycosidase family protein [Armatimonadota bacterium]